MHLRLQARSPWSIVMQGMFHPPFSLPYTTQFLLLDTYPQFYLATSIRPPCIWDCRLGHCGRSSHRECSSWEKSTRWSLTCPVMIGPPFSLLYATQSLPLNALSPVPVSSICFASGPPFSLLYTTQSPPRCLSPVLLATSMWTTMHLRLWARSLWLIIVQGMFQLREINEMVADLSCDVQLAHPSPFCMLHNSSPDAYLQSHLAASVLQPAHPSPFHMLHNPSPWCLSPVPVGSLFTAMSTYHTYVWSSSLTWLLTPSVEAIP